MPSYVTHCLRPLMNLSLPSPTMARIAPHQMSYRPIVARERGESGLRLGAAVLEDLHDAIAGQVEIVARIAVRAVRGGSRPAGHGYAARRQRPSVRSHHRQRGAGPAGRGGWRPRVDGSAARQRHRRRVRPVADRAGPGRGAGRGAARVPAPARGHPRDRVAAQRVRDPGHHDGARRVLVEIVDEVFLPLLTGRSGRT